MSRITVAVFATLVVYIASFLLHARLMTDISQWLLLLGVAGLAIYLMVESSLNKAAIRRFIETYAVAECSEAELWENIPPCFSWLNDNPELLDAQVRDGFVFPLGDGVECILFDFIYTLSSNGKRGRRYAYAIAVIREKQVFPHLFLDAKQNGSSRAYQGSQRLSLEGDFDEYFNLYVPDNESTNALVVFTPDIMAVLVDAGRPYDVELIGDSVIVVASGSQYERYRLKALFTFLSAFDMELNEKPVEWSDMDLAGILTHTLARRKYYDSKLVLWLIIALAAVALLWVTV